MNQEKFDEIVKRFKETKDNKGNNLNMHYLLIKDDENCFVHRFNNRTEKSDIRSISKTVMTLLVGIVNRLSKEGKYPKFDDETYIYPIIKDIFNLTNGENIKYIEKLQVKHLMTHTMGYDKILMMRDDIKDMDPDDYVDFIMNSPIVYEPGEYYLYSNAGFYMLSVVLQEFLGEDLLEFADRELFRPLDIEDYQW
ncbi:MAG: beta-lactamase family protein, partial [Clostridiales bacterium]|nr:beta-lactamase family protein [Clostridiales bacterium]